MDKHSTKHSLLQPITNQLMSYVLDHNKISVAIHDHELRYLYVSQSYRDAYKIQDADIIGKHHYEVFPNLPEKWRNVHQRSLNGEVVSEDEDPYVREDGSVEWTRWECRPWYRDDNTIGGIIVYTEIITESVRIRALKDEKNSELLALKETNLQLLSRAIEASSVSVVIADAEGQIIYTNPYFSKLSGYSASEVIGKNPRILKSGFHSKEFYEELWSTILSGKEWEGEFLNKKKSGEFYWLKALISPIVNAKGEITHFISVKENITDQKKLLNDLLLAKEKAEESDNLKTAFINNISHEIKTPLNSILGFGELMTDPELSMEERIVMFSYVQEAGNRLMKTVSDFMEMAMLFSENVEVNPTKFRLMTLLNDIACTTQTLCSKKSIQLKTVFPPDAVELQLFTDATLLSKILHILLDNALKFTEKGMITLGFQKRPSSIEFYVQDTGKGIAPQNLELIFEMFNQEEFSHNRSHEGSGLGLTIAKGYLNLLGGDIQVISKKGVGSSFSFTIPIS